MSGVTVDLVVQAIGWAFATGGILLAVLSIIPATRSTARQLWPVMLSEAAILVGGTVPWLLRPPLLLVLLLIAAARVGFESGVVQGFISKRGSNPVLYSISLVAAGLIGWFMTSSQFLLASAAVLVAAIGLSLSAAPRTGNGCLARFLLFPLLPVSGFCHFAGLPELTPFFLLAFFLVEIFDSFSLLGGKLYGRRPLVPRLSPRKTWEGLMTGVAAVLISLGILAYVADLPPLPMLAAAGVVTMSAIAGDLLGSLPKRQAGTKDYPKVLSVQGGLLDIVDAWLVAGPCLALFAFLTGWS